MGGYGGNRGEICEGRNCRQPCRGGISSGAAHPADWAASPLSPGSAASRGCPGSLLSGTRAASRRLRHLPENTLPQPGPTTAPTAGEAARWRSRHPLRSLGPLDRAAAQPRCRAVGQSSAPLSRDSASDTADSATQPQRYTPSSLPGGTVWRASGAAPPREGAGRERRPRPLNPAERGSWVGPLMEGGGSGPWRGRGLRRGVTTSPPSREQNPPSPTPNPPPGGLVGGW